MTGVVPPDAIGNSISDQSQQFGSRSTISASGLDSTRERRALLSDYRTAGRPNLRRLRTQKAIAPMNGNPTMTRAHTTPTAVPVGSATTDHRAIGSITIQTAISPMPTTTNRTSAVPIPDILFSQLTISAQSARLMVLFITFESTGHRRASTPGPERRPRLPEGSITRSPARRS